MRVESGILGPAHAYAIIGDGIRDKRILEAIAEKYDHGKLLRIPQTPFRGETGIKALIRKLIILIEHTRMDKYLALIDREHVESADKLCREFRGHGFDIVNVEQLRRGCLRLSVSRGAKKATIYLAILGRVKAVEENPAKLIKKLYGEHVEASKEAVDKWLRARGLREDELVRKASRRVLEESFPTLTEALQKLARN